MLIRGPILAGEAPGPHPGVDFSDGGAARGNLPPVERPEVDAFAESLTNEPQPRNSRMRRFCHRAQRAEIEDGLRAAGSFLRDATPTAVPASRGAVALVALEHGFDVDVLICRPMALEVVEERRPVGLQPVDL